MRAWWICFMEVALFAATWGAYNPWRNGQLHEERLQRWEDFKNGIK
jgi:hypothetical protein